MASKKITNRALYSKEISRIKALQTRYLNKGYATDYKAFSILFQEQPKRVTQKRLNTIKSFTAKYFQDYVYNMDTAETLREERNRKRREKRRDKRKKKKLDETPTGGRALDEDREADIIIQNTINLITSSVGIKLANYVITALDQYISESGKKKVAKAIQINENFIDVLTRAGDAYKAIVEYSNLIKQAIPTINDEELETIIDEEQYYDYY